MHVSQARERDATRENGDAARAWRRPEHDLDPVERVDARDEVARLDGRGCRHVVDVVERVDVAQVDSDSDPHARGVMASTTRVEMAERDVARSPVSN